MARAAASRSFGKRMLVRGMLYFPLADQNGGGGFIAHLVDQGFDAAIDARAVEIEKGFIACL